MGLTLRVELEIPSLMPVRLAYTRFPSDESSASALSLLSRSSAGLTKRCSIVSKRAAVARFLGHLHTLASLFACNQHARQARYPTLLARIAVSASSQQFAACADPTTAPLSSDSPLFPTFLPTPP